MGLAVNPIPTEEPITVDEAKAHARILTDADDALVGVLIRAARRHAEARCNRSFAVQAYEYTIDEFPCWAGYGYGACAELELPRPPLVAVASIEVRVSAGAEPVELEPETYRVVPGTPGLVVPIEPWPATVGPAAVTVRYSAGWTADELPEDARLAMLMLIAHWYDRREPIVTGTVVATVPFAVEALLDGVDWRTRG